MQSELEKFNEVNEKLKRVSEKVIRIEEQFKSKKQALSELLKEIKAEGFDPTKLKEIIQEKESALKNEIEAFSKAVENVSAQVAKIEA